MIVTPKVDEAVKNSADGQPTVERRSTKPWAVLAILAPLSLIAPAASTTCASAGAPRVSAASEMVWPEGIPGEAPGDLELKLNIGECRHVH